MPTSFDSSSLDKRVRDVFFENDSDGSTSEHNVWDSLLVLFAHFGVARHLVQCLGDPSGIKVATACHFAMMQDDAPTARQDGSSVFDPCPFGEEDRLDELLAARSRSHSL